MLPNFFVVGAAKSGTTSLWYYLKQHPEIFFPKNKEPNFYAFEGCKMPPCKGPVDSKTLYRKLYAWTVTDASKYQSLFEDAPKNCILGDASVRYLYFPKSCQRIHAQLPDAKIIMLLRNPVDRLYSHYIMMKGLYLLEPLDLDAALEQESQRMLEGWGWDWHYHHVSRYAHQVERYFDYFGPDNIFVSIYEDFCKKPLRVVQRIFDFLGIQDSYIPNMSKRGMTAYWPRHPNLDYFLRYPNNYNQFLKDRLPIRIYKRLKNKGVRWNAGKPPILPPSTRDWLQASFKEDIQKLEKILGRDLPW